MDETEIYTIIYALIWYTFNMKYEYDPIKSKKNAEKHGISLEQAVELWSVLSVEIAARNLDENRSMIIGKLGIKFYSCIFTMRKDTIRLISARRSRKNEEAIYHEKIKETNQN